MLIFDNVRQFDQFDTICPQNTCYSSKFLVINNKSVLLFSENGACVIQRILCESTPIAAALFSFSDVDGGEQQYSVGILITPLLLRLHAPDGQCFDINLDVATSRIFSCSLGLMIEQHAPPILPRGEKQSPFLFTLSQQLAPVRPLFYNTVNIGEIIDRESPLKNSSTQVHDGYDGMTDSFILLTVLDSLVFTLSKINGCIKIFELVKLVDNKNDTKLNEPSYSTDKSSSYSGANTNHSASTSLSLTHTQKPYYRNRKQKFQSTPTNAGKKDETIANILGAVRTPNLESYPAQSTSRMVEPEATLAYRGSVPLPVNGQYDYSQIQISISNTTEVCGLNALF